MTIKQCFKKWGLDIGDISVINEKIETEFQELHAQISGEIIFDEYIHFDAETVTSEPAVDPKQADWRQECCSKKNGIKIRRYCFNQRLGLLNCWWLTRY